MNNTNNTSNKTNWRSIGCLVLTVILTLTFILFVFTHCSFDSSDERGSNGTLPKWQEDKIKRDFERDKAYYGDFNYIR